MANMSKTRHFADEYEGLLQIHLIVAVVQVENILVI